MSLPAFLEKFLSRWRGPGGTSRGGGAEKAAQCARTGDQQDLEGFDWKFYVRFHPDLRKTGINNKKRAIRHWLQYGLAEGRIGGREHRTFQDNLKILTESLKTAERRAAEANATLANRSAPLINILTRSNKRPRFFHDNRSSVVGQDYKNFRQLVSYENEATLKYLKKEHLPAGDLIRVVRQQTGATHPYNLFVNDLMDHVADGWILFLDDDDLFTTPHALPIIASQLEDENRLVIWRAWFPDKNVPSVKDVNQIEAGGITSCCFAFHSRHKESARWHEFKAGDFRCFDQLRKFLKPVFLDDVLAKVNYTDCGAGWGEARDKKK